MMLRVPSSPCTARVVVLAGPSGSGKTRLAARLRLPVLALDDFYPDGSDPLLPHLQAGATGSLIDWDHPDSWDADRALAALRTLCLTTCPYTTSPGTGAWATASSPSEHRRTWSPRGSSPRRSSPPCATGGLLAAAVCVRHRRIVAFVLRLARDLREHRKPPHVLVTRGWRLMRAEPRIVARMRAQGCESMSPRRAERTLRGLVDAAVQAPSTA